MSWPLARRLPKTKDNLSEITEVFWNWNVKTSPEKCVFLLSLNRRHMKKSVLFFFFFFFSWFFFLVFLKCWCQCSWVMEGLVLAGSTESELCCSRSLWVIWLMLHVKGCATFQPLSYFHETDALRLWGDITNFYEMGGCLPAIP